MDLNGVFSSHGNDWLPEVLHSQHLHRQATKIKNAGAGKARLRERLRRGTHPSSPQRQPLASHGFPKKDSQLWINVDQLCRKGQKGLVIFHCHFGRVEGWPTWLYQQHIACSQAPSKDQGSTNKYIITIFVVHYIITSTLLQQISTSLQ